MGEMSLLGSREMLDKLIPKEAKEIFDLDVVGGDTKIVWNPRDRDETANARRTFDELAGSKRFNAYRVDQAGEPGEKISDFDPEAGKLILAPPMAGGCR